MLQSKRVSSITFRTRNFTVIFSLNPQQLRGTYLSPLNHLFLSAHLTNWRKISLAQCSIAYNLAFWLTILQHRTLRDGTTHKIIITAPGQPSHSHTTNDLTSSDVLDFAAE